MDILSQLIIKGGPLRVGIRRRLGVSVKPLGAWTLRVHFMLPDGLDGQMLFLGFIWIYGNRSVLQALYIQTLHCSYQSTCTFLHTHLQVRIYNTRLHIQRICTLRICMCIHVYRNMLVCFSCNHILRRNLNEGSIPLRKKRGSL